MSKFISIILLISYHYSAFANLEGPFLFWGPRSLKQHQRPALSFLGIDDLTQIYTNQGSIVVFNNVDSATLSSGNFPRLRKMLEEETSLVLPQDFLEVHPDYVSNDTLNLTLLGPWSERDAQITETFERLEDIYGDGRVLAILGNSRSMSDAERLAYGRVKRNLEDGESAVTEADEKPTSGPRTTAAAGYSLYNASGPSGKALLYSSGWPVMRWPDGSETVLNNQIGEPTVKPTRLYTMLVVRFAYENTKITLEFSFKQSAGWWTSVGVEVKKGVEPGLNLQAPQPPEAPSAVLGRAYHCSLPLVFTSRNASLTLPDIQMQPFMESTERFSDSFDCVGFTSVPIWSGMFITSIMILGLSMSITMILDIKTMDRFDGNRSRQLTITVSE